MFDRETVGVRICGINHHQMDRDEMEVPLVIMTCEIAPFTPELAGELHGKARRNAAEGDATAAAGESATAH